MQTIGGILTRSICAAVLFVTINCPVPAPAQQQEMPEITIATAVGNMAYSAVWIAEQLKYFEQEGVRAKITVAGGGAPCQSAVVGRSIHLCASSSEGLILANQEGASLIAVQAHNRNMTLGITVRKAIVDKRAGKKCSTFRSALASSKIATKLRRQKKACSGRINTSANLASSH